MRYLVLITCRFLMPDYRAVASQVGDWLQYSTCVIVVVPEWIDLFTTFSSGMSWIGLIFDASWYYFAILIALIPLWILYMILFWSGGAAKLALFREGWFKWALLPASYLYVWIVGSVFSQGHSDLIHLIFFSGSCFAEDLGLFRLSKHF